MNINIKNPIHAAVIVLSIAIIGVIIFWSLSTNSKSQNSSISSLATTTDVGNVANVNTNNNGNLPPEKAINACSNKAVGDVCEFSDKGTSARGTCDNKPGVLACRKDDTANNQQPSTKSPIQATSTKNTKTPPTTTKSTNQPKTNTAPAGGQSGYSIEQAISDQAQLNTLAFDGLGFLTGNTCSDSFLPPGKVADFFGFQYLRDVTQAGKGHSTDFVTNAANGVLKTLNTTQKAKMIALAKTQASLVNNFAYKRFPLMVAFRRNLEGNIPSGTTGLSKTAVMQYSGDIYALDATISLQRAQLFSDIIKSVDSTQKTYLDGMVKGGFATWEALPDQVDKTTLTHDEHVLVMTYASEMLGWYAGNIESDTYFCPERQGDYFGGFYIKDAPAIGNAGYTIDESITGDKGEAFINALTSTQKPIITAIVNTQRTAINSIVEKRRAISTELRKALSIGGTIDESKIMTLAREYGQLDGEISYYYASAFAQVGKTLTTEQKAKLVAIKDLSAYTCPISSAYLYSEKITIPSVVNTDFLFN